MHTLQRTASIFTLIVISLLPTVSWAEDPEGQLTPLGPDFQLNEDTSGSQLGPVVAGHDHGFVVTWDSYDSETYSSIQARRFDLDGAALGGQFQVSQPALDDETSPDVEAWSDGRFVVVWASNINDAVNAQIFNSDGSPLGEQLEVVDASSIVGYPRVTVEEEGFLVLWSSLSSSAGKDVFPGDGDGLSIQARRFSSVGTGIGSIFQVNSNTTGDQASPSASRLADGSTWVTWREIQEAGTENEAQSVQLRRLAPEGTPVGTDFRVDSGSTGINFGTRIATALDGSFIVAWTGGELNNLTALARRFSAGPTPLPQGSQFQVNEQAEGEQSASDVQPLPDDGFLVIWDRDEDPSSGVDLEVAASRFGSQGERIGGDFVLNSLTPDSQRNGRIAEGREGEYFAVWHSGISAEDDTDETSIQGRLFRFEDPVFADGFESANTSEWLSTPR